MLDDEFMQQHYAALLGFAISQLQDKARAEDVVQEALMSAMQHKDSFQGESALKTWVFAILKNKIIDTLRREQKYISLNTEADDAEDLLFSTLFSESGRWQDDVRPMRFDHSWYATQSDDIQAQDFWQTLTYCLENLPAEQARVFLMREYMELDTKEICQHCQISQQNFYVLMHRARLRLQYCLKLNWFEA